MADFTFDAACALIGRTAWIELNWPDVPEPTLTCVHIVGVVMALEGVYDAPHFLTFKYKGSEMFPEELFWSDIRALHPVRTVKREGMGRKAVEVEPSKERLSSSTGFEARPRRRA